MHVLDLVRPLMVAGLMFALPAQAQDAELPADVAAGKALYDVMTRGGYGCRPCHGPDGLGSGDGPKIIGQDMTNIKYQIETNDSMSFIDLSDEEYAQIAAYLRYLVR
jgi:mono/diheme cytochrome c family protein